MIKLPAFISDGMVISKKAKIWGWTKPDENVSIEFLGNVYTVTSDDTGRFEVVVLAENYGGPHIMTIGDTNINDVYVGRVWLCGGQSNMEGSIERTRLLMPHHIVEDSRIRMFQVEKGLRFDMPANNTNGKWRTATGNMDDLFAVPYFFARQLLTDDPTPIGLLCTPAGGTPIEGWLPEEIVQEFPGYYNELLPMKDTGFIEAETGKGNIRVQSWHKKLADEDIGLAEKWESPDYNDDTWETRMLLDPSGLPKHGAVWLRKRVSLPKHSGKVMLKFGRIVNSVKVFVNGQQVTSVEYMYPPCVCTLPEGLLKEGENLIAIRIVGDSNSPHAVPGKEYALIGEGWYVDLSGEWKKRVGTDMPMCGSGAWFYGRPCGVYNFMLAPVLGYSIDGMIWYQGESNTGRTDIYKDLFTAFTKHMRTHFGENLPIIFNQLANFGDANNGIGENWAKLREQQRKCLEIPNTAMSVSIDCGEWNDIHPLDKKTVGERMALHARKLAYNQDLITDGPSVLKAVCNDGKLTIHFKYGVGLWAKNGYPILDVIDKTGYAHKFYGIIKGETLVVDIGKISAKYVRFGWVDCPSVSVYNAYNLPASPFEIEIT